VKNHGGTITCYSTPNEGTTFRIYLPTSKEQADSSPQPVKTNAPFSGSEKILVVDDEPSLLEIACDILSYFGYTCLQAVSGEEALQQLDQEKDHIDLVLLDLNMPGMGGFKCLEQIGKKKHPPQVIVASGYAANGNTQNLLDAGACYFLQKPYQVNELVKAVRKVLDKK